MLDVKKQLGKDGLCEVLLVLEEAYNQKADHLDVDKVKNWAFVKSDRAIRLLPYAEKALAEAQKIYLKSTQNLPKIYPKSTQNLPDFTPSNPCGSTRDKKITKQNKINPPKSPKQESVFFLQFWTDYPKRQGKKVGRKECLEYWEAENLDTQAAAILEGLEAWKITDGWQEQDGKFVPDPIRWLKKESWKDDVGPIKPLKVVSFIDTLMEAPAIRNSFDPKWVIPTNEIERRGDELYHSGRRLCEGEFSPCWEA